MSRPLLEVRDLSMRFGGLLAVNGVSLDVQTKQVVSM
ncbi:MAG: high-affinity branched-chain amino acid ABC transporter ATP-binding protein LivG, partial [Pseudomonas sagittaria]|nr:high-affinity branched-chain amino acid ABC transporter ATP-binding protein LivG [Pseudomonas sagittaria]